MGRQRNSHAASRHLIAMGALLLLGFFPTTPGFAVGPPNRVEADGQRVPNVRWLQGRTQGIRVGEGLKATLDLPVSNALVRLGGTVVLAGQAPTQCQMTLDMVGETHTISLGPERRVVAVNIAWDPPMNAKPTVDWTITTNDCEANIEGVLLFVGDAAAYVDRDPEHYWRRHAGSRGAMLAPGHPQACDWTRATALRWPH